MNGHRRQPRPWRVLLPAMVLFLSCSSFARAYVCVTNPSELQTALDEAAGNSLDDEIRLVQGTYAGNFTYVVTTGYSLTLRGGYTGDCSAAPSQDPALTVLDAGGTGRALLATSSAAAPFNFALENLTFQNGAFPGPEPLYERKGAGVHANNATLTVDRCSFLNNQSPYKGGGLFLNGTATQVVRNSRFEGNSGSYGGGCWFEQANMVQFENSVLKDNTAVGNTGGGVMLWGVANTRFLSNEVTGNMANSGGGLFTMVSASVVLSGNVLSGNGASNQGGGAYLTPSATVTNNTVSGNGASQGGGLFFISQKSTDSLDIRNNIIQGNYAAEAGGDIYLDQSNVGYASIRILHNDFKQSSPDGFYNRTTGPGFVIDPSNLDNQDPLFVSPAGVPAPTSAGNYRIRAGSPCADQGDNAAPELPAADKDGNLRIVNAVVDQGAWELPLPPATPTGFAASDGTFTSRVTLTWGDVAGVDGYRIYRSSDDVTYDVIGEAAAGVTAYNDLIACGTSYWYKVTAFSQAGESSPAGPDQGSTGTCPSSTPAAPAFIAASDGSSLDQIDVTWENVSGEDGYYLYRAESLDGIYVKIADLTIDATSYADAVGCEQIFFYKVTAYNSLGESPLAGPDEGFSGACHAPATPAGVAASAGTFPDLVRVSWEDVAWEDGYHVYRSETIDGTFVNIGNPVADATSFDDQAVACGQSFWYRVSAYNAYGESALSDPVAGSTEACPLFTDTFFDRKITDHWRVWSGQWAVTPLAPRSLYSSSAYDNIITARFGSVGAGRVVADLKRTTTYTQYPNAAVVFAFRDAANYRYVQLKSNRIIISQKGTVGLAPPGSVFVARLFPFPLTSLHRLRVDIRQGGRVEVYVDSETTPRVSATFPDTRVGRVGFWAFNAKSHFDNFSVWNASVLAP